MKRLYVSLAAIAAITGIELYALSQGINGTLMTVAFSVIAGLAGYNLKLRGDAK